MDKIAFLWMCCGSCRVLRLPRRKGRHEDWEKNPSQDVSILVLNKRRHSFPSLPHHQSPRIIRPSEKGWATWASSDFWRLAWHTHSVTLATDWCPSLWCKWLGGHPQLLISPQYTPLHATRNFVGVHTPSYVADGKSLNAS